MKPVKMQHTTVAIDSIEPHPLNVRQGDVGLITSSLKEHGQYRPIVVQTSTNRILAGNHTYKAAKALKWKQIEATFIDCDDDQALRILLMDNRANDVASYDDHALVSMLKEMMETELKLDGTGFDPSDLDDLIRDLELADEKPHLTDHDAVPDDAPSKTVTGDVWLLGKHRLMCGDSTSPTDIAKLMAGKKADLVFTDPPYRQEELGGQNDLIGKAVNKKTQQISDMIDFHPETFLLTLPTVFQNKTMNAYIFCNKELIPDYLNWALENKYSFNVLFWKKPNGMPLASSHRPDVEYIMFIRKNATWNNSVAGVNYSKCLEYSRQSGTPHPTMKPVALIENELQISSPLAGLVVDFFGGSGSTLIAAHETNRVAYLMELDPKYCDVICKRWEQLTGVTPIAEATGNPHTFL